MLINPIEVLYTFIAHIAGKAVMRQYPGPDQAQPVLASSLVGTSSPDTRVRRGYGYVSSHVRFGDELPPYLP